MPVACDLEVKRGVIDEVGNDQELTNSNQVRSEPNATKNDIRHLLGKPTEIGPIREALKTGRRRQRAAAVLELVPLQPWQPLFEVRARGER